MLEKSERPCQNASCSQLYDISLISCHVLCSCSALRGRVYLPQDELAKYGLSEKDIFSRKVTDGWREFMKEQITRARVYFNQAEKGASQLDKASRWPVMFRYMHINFNSSSL